MSGVFVCIFTCSSKDIFLGKIFPVCDRLSFVGLLMSVFLCLCLYFCVCIVCLFVGVNVIRIVISNLVNLTCTFLKSFKFSDLRPSRNKGPF